MREFTAFDRGLDWADEELERYDLVHFATSAFETLYTGYLERFCPAVLRLAAERHFCLGHVDCYNDPVRLLGFVSQHWIRTCFFFLAPAEIRALGSLGSLVQGDRFFSGDPDAPFKDTAPLSPNYRRYIVNWLTGADIGQNVRWHSTMRLDSETLAAFEHKALCILNEHLLAIRLRAMGCPLVDVTWLTSQRDPESALESHVPWRGQLAGRDRDRVRPG